MSDDSDVDAPTPGPVAEPDPREPATEDSGGFDSLFDLVWPQTLRRIKACVDACQNIPTEYLEAGVIGDLCQESIQSGWACGRRLAKKMQEAQADG